MAGGRTTLDNGSIYNADVAALAAIGPDKMAQRTDARFPVDLGALRVWDSAATPLPCDGTLEGAALSVSYCWDPTSADDSFFVACRAYRVVGIRARVEVAGTDGGAVTIVVKKVASGTDVASGTALHTGSVDLKGTVDVHQTLTLSATSSVLDVAAGTAIGIDLTGTPTAARGVVTVLLAPAASPDDLRVVSGAYGTDPSYVGTGDVKAAGATVKYARLALRVPYHFEANQTLTLRLIAGMKTSIADVSASVDVEVWRNDADGTLGAADICETAAKACNSLTAANYDFIITPDTVSPGDVLDVRITLSVNDAATVASVIGAIWQIEFRVDLR